MRYFTDTCNDKNSKIGITNLLGNITQKADSHKGGWTKLLACQLRSEGYANVKILDKDDKFSDFNIIIFDLGAEFSGGINLFGGLDEKVYNRLVEIMNYEGALYSRQHDLPDMEALRGRMDNKSTCLIFKENGNLIINNLKSTLSKCATFDHVAKKKHLLFGDSHTPSVWTPDMEIHRQDGRTLFGTLVGEKLDVYKDSDYEEVTLYMGNIDIRHHLMRQGHPWDAVQTLCMNYERAIQENFSDKKVHIIGALPIENESRKLPKTGYYKGTPFAGKWNERAALSEIFNGVMERACFRNGWQFMKFPLYFKNTIGELDFGVMERPGSVHISPAHYRWNLEENKRRW